MRSGVVMSITRSSARILFSRISPFALLLLFFVSVWSSIFNIGIAQATIIRTPSSEHSDNGHLDNPVIMEISSGSIPEKFLTTGSDGKNALNSDSILFDIFPKNKLFWHIPERNEICSPAPAGYVRQEVVAGLMANLTHK